MASCSVNMSCKFIDLHIWILFFSIWFTAMWVFKFFSCWVFNTYVLLMKHASRIWLEICLCQYIVCTVFVYFFSVFQFFNRFIELWVCASTKKKKNYKNKRKPNSRKEKTKQNKTDNSYVALGERIRIGYFWTPALFEICFCTIYCLWKK